MLPIAAAGRGFLGRKIDLDDEAFQERRRAPRVSTAIAATTRTPQGTRHQVVINDLSPEGCAVMAAGPLFRLGETYSLRFAGLEALLSTTAWTNGQLAGLAFAAPLHPAVADHVTARHPPPTQSHE